MMRINIGFAMALSIIVAIGIASYRSIDRSVELARERMRLRSVVWNINDALSALKDAESSERGYLLTGNVKLKEAYFERIKTIHSELKELHTQIDPTTQHPAQIADIQALVGKKITLMTRAVEARENGPLSLTKQTETIVEGERLMEEVRQRFLEFWQFYIDRLTEVADEQAGYRETSRLVFLGCALAFGIVAVATYLLNRDVHRRKRLEAEREKFHAMVEKSQAFLDSIIENMPLMIFIKEANSLRFVRFNKAGGDLLGCDPKELIGKNDYDFFPKAQADFFTSKDRQVLTGQSLVDIPEELIDTKHGPRLLHTRKVGMTGPDGAHYLVGISEDITERKQNERELEAARLAAEQAARVKAEFLANMSHEIRTPLNGIIGMADLLLETQLSESQRRYARIVQDSSLGLLTVINDILDFSKIEAGKLSLELIEFSPRAVVEGQVELLAAKAREKKLGLLSFIEPDVPEVLMGDPGRIAQVLLNLIGNAIKFTTEGAVIVRARLDNSAADQIIVRFSVHDSGPGLSRQARHRLFQPFTQVDGSMARRYGGTGLGLSISKRLVEMMEGEIGVESEPGQGSNFWFTTRLQKSSQKALPMDLGPALVGLQVFLIDECPASAEIMANYARSWNMEPETAVSGEAGLQQLRQSAARSQAQRVAIVSDRLRDMEAETFIKQCQRDAQISDTRLIFLTGFGQALSDEELSRLGWSGQLTRPLRQADLFHEINSAVLNRKPLPSQNPTSLANDNFTPRAKILVAEDNAVNQLLAMQQLKSLGYQVQTVANGREVLSALADANFDLILMDCQMPEMDGYEATREIRALERNRGDGRHVIIVALTASAMKEDHARSLEAGMDDYLSKPIRKDHLAAVIEQWLKKHLQNTG